MPLVYYSIYICIFMENKCDYYNVKQSEPEASYSARRECRPMCDPPTIDCKRPPYGLVMQMTCHWLTHHVSVCLRDHFASRGWISGAQSLMSEFNVWMNAASDPSDPPTTSIAAFYWPRAPPVRENSNAVGRSALPVAFVRRLRL